MTGRERLAAVVEKPRAQAAISSLRAEGVYDDDRSVYECGEGAVAIPVTDHPRRRRSGRWSARRVITDSTSPKA